ncbi:MAG: HAD family hydrolase [Bdellovibrionota bacterium]|nr:HAD family hydrolase [Bdellovibrionota bacterium]
MKLVFSDFDGTLTYNDELTVHFHDILKLLKGHGVPLVICTGRSKSWAHFLLSHFFDLTHVISEGGGTLSSVTVDGLGRRHLSDRLLVPEEEADRLEKIAQELVQKFPLRLSVDSFGRHTDRAIELSDLNDNPSLDKEVRAFLKENEVNFSTSNVHLNFWCGEISKMKAINTFLSEYGPQELEETLFFGDSLNDQSVFRDHPKSVGVANIAKVLDVIEHRPAVILTGEENEGPLGVLNYLKSLLK